MRLKIEINCNEHFHVFDWVDYPYQVHSEWFVGQCSIRKYGIDELLGSKLRALYQRSKGRDLFDLDYARRNLVQERNHQVKRSFKEIWKPKKLTHTLQVIWKVYCDQVSTTISTKLLNG